MVLANFWCYLNDNQKLYKPVSSNKMYILFFFFFLQKKCTYSSCKNNKNIKKSDVWNHLYRNGFMSSKIVLKIEYRMLNHGYLTYKDMLDQDCEI